MNAASCSQTIALNIGTSPCGSVFKYRNYVDPTPHIKFVIAHDKGKGVLCVVNATSQDFSAFRYSQGIGESIISINNTDYSSLTKETYVECCSIEEISIDELVEKCANGDRFETHPRISKTLLYLLQKTALDSIHTPGVYVKRIRRCIDACV
jgi:hypothetical protein